MSCNVSNNMLEGEIPPNLILAPLEQMMVYVEKKMAKGSSEPPTDVGVAKLAATIKATADMDFDVIENGSNGNAAELEVQVSFSNRPKEMGVA
ncbi:hypothetical protein SADUNF_Sadunf03G0042600 [Salix dunnii]|uniref:Uncharacterized protein n=1 Tax=Salix dunnii TaxID=1413687 RepID=A0A835KB81_9ROSI|nr:hypothetical protein SADUNF_Sadunf03G0042600 [Salix dunnii]